MRGYEREPKYFKNVPEFTPLFELRTQLVAQAARMRQRDSVGQGSGATILELAREMDGNVRKLDAATTMLEKRAETISNK